MMDPRCMPGTSMRTTRLYSSAFASTRKGSDRTDRQDTRFYGRVYRTSALFVRKTPRDASNRKIMGVCHCLSSKPKELAEESHFDKLWKELLGSVQYLSKDELDQVGHALQLAYGAHKGQKRKSGDPYIIHPVSVACILGELEMDVESIIAGLLHDVVEDTDKLTFDEIECIFGHKVRNIVEGETKVSKLKHDYGNSSSERNAYDMQQLFIAMTEEIRIIIVKLADRLHNMRTLMHMPRHKQTKIARETLTIFAPLAHLLGLHLIKEELEDLSFYHSEPEEYNALKQRVKQLRFEQSAVVYEAKEALASVLESDEFFQSLVEKVEIKMANRSLYSLHKKLKANGQKLTDIQNVAQLHVIVHPKSKEQERQVCYHSLGRVHQIWAPIPGRFKDYIATPRSNNYQSIHTSVIPLGSKDLFPLDIQIRSYRMNEMAEKGYAAHRALVEEEKARLSNFPTLANGTLHNSNGIRKNGNGNGHRPLNGILAQEDLWQTSWLNSVKQWQQEFVGNVTAEEFVETVVGDFLPKTIFVFTPDGNVVSVPKGATVVDFAYQIHTDIGNQMLMAKVNGVPTHPSHELELAEVIEIVRHQGPPTEDILRRQKDYLGYAKSRSTRHKIVKFMKAHAHILSSAPVDKKTLQAALNNDDLAEAFASPYQPGEVIWLILRCSDRVGLLATVASIISASGLSIRAYSGTKNEYSNVFLMNFELCGKPKASKLSLMCDTLNELDSVHSSSTGCNWMPPSM